MTEPTFKFTCESCGVQFEAHADAMREVFIGPMLVSEADWEEIKDEPGVISLEQLERMSEYELSEYGLTEEDRQLLLCGGAVPVGGICLCTACQDALDERGQSGK